MASTAVDGVEVLRFLGQGGYARCVGEHKTLRSARGHAGAVVLTGLRVARCSPASSSVDARDPTHCSVRRPCRCLPGSTAALTPCYWSLALKQIPRDKIVSAQQKERLEAEKRVLLRASAGSFLCRGVGAWEDEREVSLLMEHIDGRPLYQCVWGYRDSGRLPEHVAKFFAAQIVLAVQELHELGFIHRDLKSGNVLVDITGKATVIDFGLSKRISDGDGDRGPARADSVCGTPYILAPEVFQRRGHGFEVDWWCVFRWLPPLLLRASCMTKEIKMGRALGVIIYEMVRGRPPWEYKIPPRCSQEQYYKQIANSSIGCLDEDNPSTRSDCSHGICSLIRCEAECGDISSMHGGDSLIQTQPTALSRPWRSTWRRWSGSGTIHPGRCVLEGSKQTEPFGTCRSWLIRGSTLSIGTRFARQAITRSDWQVRTTSKRTSMLLADTQAARWRLRRRCPALRALTQRITQSSLRTSNACKGMRRSSASCSTRDLIKNEENASVVNQSSYATGVTKSCSDF
jgi:serine/threonine protein kinase